MRTQRIRRVTTPGSTRNYERKGRKYSLEEVLPYVSMVPGRKRTVVKEFDGDEINLVSLRLTTFAIKGVVCKYCGVTGTHFRKERGKDQKHYHFNLYGYDKNGVEVLMTKDHAVSKHQGGGDDVYNLDPCCYRCNKEKGSRTHEEYVKVLQEKAVSC